MTNFATVGSRIRVHDPDERVRKYCREKLTLDNPEYLRRKRMGMWTGNTPAKLYLFEEDSHDLLLPYGSLFDLAEAVPGLTWTEDFEEHPADFGGADVPLYDYQEKAVSYMEVFPNGILQSPAGSGKTQMGIALAARLGRKTLWITHTQDLLRQSFDRAAQYIDRDKLGTITEGKVKIGSAMTFATVQTLQNPDILLLHKSDWDTVIVDECHRVGYSAKGMTMFARVLNALEARYKIGLSATVHRADGLIGAVFALIGNIAYAVPEAAVAGKVMPVSVRFVPTGVGQNDNWLNTDGTLNYAGMITDLAENDWRNRFIAGFVANDAAHPSLILSERIGQLTAIRDALPEELREKSVLVTGKMTTKAGKAERAQAMEDMRSGSKQILFATYALAKEGLDIPRLERLYLATPQKDSAVITQSVGRIARTCAGKQIPVCFDFVDNLFGYIKSSYRARQTVYRKLKCQLLN